MGPTRNFDILVVDDRVIDAEATLYAIRRSNSAARIVWLRSGNDALAFLFSVGEFRNRRSGMPRIILLDADMPVMSGRCVLDVLRSHPLTRHLTIALVSQENDSLEIRGQGAFEPNAHVDRACELESYCSQIDMLLSRWLPHTQRPLARVHSIANRRRANVSPSTLT